MIIEFTVGNYGPFRDDVTLNFKPTKLTDSDDNILSVGNLEALNTISVFGPNAAGKSRLLHALAILSNMMRFPLPANMPIPFYDPFRLDPSTRNAATRMSIVFEDEGTLFEYTLSFNSERVIEESLYYSPNGVRSKVFSRSEDKIAVTTTPSGRKLGQIRGNVGKNSTFVSVAAQFNHDICLQVNRAMSNVILLTGDMNDILNATIIRMNKDPAFREKLIEAMNVADFSISGISGSVKEKHVADMCGIIPDQIIGLMMATGSQKINEMSLNITHDVSSPGLSDADRTFPYLLESNGTLQMLYLMGPVIEALRTGAVIAIDEFGSFLDNSICRWIIGLFRRDKNPKCAQLIINTHDQLLMDTDELFRRDQIYFVSKDRNTQKSSIRVLSEFSIRKEYDPRKGFALGKFGSRPIILDEGWSEFD